MLRLFLCDGFGTFHFFFVLVFLGAPRSLCVPSSPPSIHVLVLLQICRTGGQLHYSLIRYKALCRMVNEVHSITALRPDAIRVHPDHGWRLSSRTRRKCSSGKQKPPPHLHWGTDRRLFAKPVSRPVASSLGGMQSRRKG